MTSASTGTMKGLVVDHKNKTISLQTDLEIPPADGDKGEVLVRVKSCSVNPFDKEAEQGRFDFFFKIAGAMKKPVKTGLEFSGEIVQKATNKAIEKKDGKEEQEHFEEGDKVFGYVEIMGGWKSHAEYLSIPEDYIAKLPTTAIDVKNDNKEKEFTFQDGAAIPMGALTSLVALETVGGLSAGQSVLINGASGGLGVYAVQIGTILGANVTAVASAKNHEFLKELGATTVLDYSGKASESTTTKTEGDDKLTTTTTTETKKKDGTDAPFPGSYDVIFDLAGNLCLSKVKNNLLPGGTFIPAEPNWDMTGLLWSSIVSAFNSKAKTVGYLMVDRGNREKLTRIAGWVEGGKLVPVIDSVYEFDNYEQAFERLSVKGKRGRIIMDV